MNHRIATKTLHRDMDHRNSLVKNMATSLILEEKMVTTLTKAKYIRPKIERLITRARLGETFNNVKYMKNKLTKKEAIKKLLSDIALRFTERKGGYTRIVKLPNRAGDNAPMARIEFVETTNATN